MTSPSVFTYPTTVSPRERARDLLAAVRAGVSDTPEGRALWHACDGLEQVLRNHYALGLAVEAVAARIADEVEVAP